MRPEITIICIQCRSAMKREPYIQDARHVHFSCFGPNEETRHEKWNYCIAVKEFNYAMSILGTK